MSVISLEGIDIGDLEFIRDQILAGNWITAHGAINAVTNTISIIPASGKTLFLYKAKIVIRGNTAPATVSALNTTSSANNRVEAALKIDGTTEDTTNLGMSSLARSAGGASNAHTSAYGNTGDGRLDATGLSLVGDGAKAVTIENIADNGSADATLSGYVNDT